MAYCNYCGNTVSEMSQEDPNFCIDCVVRASECGGCNKLYMPQGLYRDFPESEQFCEECAGIGREIELYRLGLNLCNKMRDEALCLSKYRTVEGSLTKLRDIYELLEGYKISFANAVKKDNI
jgi:hypothetical protein